MVFLIYYVIGWIVGLAAMFITGATKDVASAAYILLLYQLTVTVGLTGILGGYGHLFMGDRVARSIGWHEGTLFQVELGYCCLGMGLLGVMSFWYRDNFWLATIVFTTVFLIGAAMVHIKEMLQKKNFNPGNAITTIPDFLIPITLFVLWFLAKK
ncbi:MAG: stearoyl-CoA 9-desaturase [Calditrichaeota bacterium]|nr:stearoyl-CoA 9-desaturase [Calditrichota bacterium]